MKTSILINTDSYKHSHFLQYPPETKIVHSYIESRGGAYPEVLFFGLQAFIKEYLLQPITMADVIEAEAVCMAHGEPFNREGWEYIVKQHGGLMPVEIKAAPEGSVIPTHNVLVTVENTDEKCFWLTSFIETAILRAVWYPSTVATTSYRIKKIIKDYLDETGDPAGLLFKLHDFGARGASSNETAALGGLAHLVNFRGSDTMVALMAARRYYGEQMAGFSIPAAEHSTMTSWGKQDEAKAYANMVQAFGGDGKLYACVSDSYDIFNAVEKIWGENLKELVLKKGGTLVVRPDSGDPVTVVTKVVEKLGEKFGYTVNKKGFKVLNPAVRVIQGDGVNEQSIGAILLNLRGHGWSADNVAFGMGGALLQGITRDTNRWAMKCSAINVNGWWFDVFKDPVTDTIKKSKKGRLTLVKTPEGFKTQSYTVGWSDKEASVLRAVFRDGKLLIDDSLQTIRDRADETLVKIQEKAAA